MYRNPDPKHGRWILPIVVVAMVAFTYLFVNNLEPGTVAPAETTIASTTTTTQPDEGVTTTTLAAPVQTYLDQLNAQRDQVVVFLADATNINDSWDRRAETGATFQDTLLAMRDLSDRVTAFRDAFAAVVPPAEAPQLAGPAADLTAAAEALNSSAIRMVDGLQASDTGELRRGALADFQEAAQAFTDGVTAAATVASQPAS